MNPSLGPARGRIVALALLLAGLVLGAVALADGFAGTRPSCVAVRKQPWNLGNGFFNHLVTVRNGCSQPVRCRITTDANPAPTQVEVPAGAERTVNTFVSSPASGFTPTVDCETAH